MSCGCNDNLTLTMPYGEIIYFTVTLFTCLLDGVVLLLAVQIYKLLT